VAPNAGPMTLGGTNTYVVGRDPAYVVDPGPEFAEHIDAVRREGEARGGIAGAVLTHSHADHSAGVEALGEPLMWGAVSGSDETRWVPDPTAVVRGEVPPGWEAIPTPGHAPDHVAFVWGDVCFCGDLILGEGSTIVPPAAFGGSLGDYMASLRRVRELGARLLAPGHGPLIEEPEAKVDEYLTHREGREERLVAALEAGERSRSRLLDEVWDDVPDVLLPAAAMAMQAHLEKLAAERRLELSELLE
jgi:glyoxylase-like metal-dependent hydrolase (beta-lactamase superfamily II)